MRSCRLSDQRIFANLHLLILSIHLLIKLRLRFDNLSQNSLYKFFQFHISTVLKKISLHLEEGIPLPCRLFHPLQDVIFLCVETDRMPSAVSFVFRGQR